MKINVRSLGSGLHDFEFTAMKEELNLAENDNFVNEVNIHSVVDKRASSVYIKSRVTTKASFVCDNCLKEFTKSIEDSFSLYFSLDQEDASLDEGDVMFLDSSTQEIDLEPDVRECLLLAVPMKLICSPECKGLCSDCGANLNEETCECTHENIDPRWEALKKLIA